MTSVDHVVASVGKRGNMIWKWEEADRIPLLLHINHESREFAKSRYVLDFDGLPGAKTLYWNPHRDIVCMGDVYVPRGSGIISLVRDQSAPILFMTEVVQYVLSKSLLLWEYY